jgi:quercetin dioxygenase-like cupin family protein
MRVMTTIFLLAACISTTVLAADPPKVRAAPLLVKSLDGVQGKEGLLLTVELEPGAESAPHRHNANTFVYVIEGTIVMQVKGGEAVTLKAGQTFYESPTDIHTVSKNASTTERAKFVVFMVKDVGVPASVPVN